MINSFVKLLEMGGVPTSWALLITLVPSIFVMGLAGNTVYTSGKKVLLELETVQANQDSIKKQNKEIQRAQAIITGYVYQISTTAQATNKKHNELALELAKRPINMPIVNRIVQEIEDQQKTLPHHYIRVDSSSVTIKYTPIQR